MSIDKSHVEIAKVCKDAVGIGVSFEFLDHVIAEIIRTINRLIARRPVPIKTSKGTVYIQAKAPFKAPIVRAANGGVLEISDVSIDVDFIVEDGGTIERLNSYTVEYQQINVQVLVDKDDGSLLTGLIETVGYVTSSGNPPPNLPDILKRYGIDDKRYPLAEQVQLVLAEEALANVYANSIYLPGLLDFMKLLRIQAPVSIGFTDEYLLIFSEVASLKKPPCDSGVAIAAAARRSPFQRSPIVFYLPTVQLHRFVEHNIPDHLVPKQRKRLGQFATLEVWLETEASRRPFVVRAFNVTGGNPNKGRIAISTDIHAHGNIDTTIFLPPCTRIRGDVATLEFDTITLRATHTAHVPAKEWRVVGSAQVDIPRYNVRSHGPLPPVILNTAIAAAIAAVNAAAKNAVFQTFSAQMFTLETALGTLFPGAGFDLVLESDGVPTSILYGLMPVPAG